MLAPGAEKEDVKGWLHKRDYYAPVTWSVEWPRIRNSCHLLYPVGSVLHEANAQWLLLIPGPRPLMV